MGIKELDVVKLKDGREGTVVHLYEGSAAEVDFGETFETVENEEIIKIIWASK